MILRRGVGILAMHLNTEITVTKYIKRVQNCKWVCRRNFEKVWVEHWWTLPLVPLFEGVFSDFGRIFKNELWMNVIKINHTSKDRTHSNTIIAHFYLIKSFTL